MAYEHFYVPGQSEYSAELFEMLPVLLYAGIVADEPTWSLSEHFHEYPEIVYIISGEGRYIINGVGYIVGAGNLLIYNKGVRHEEHSSSENPLKTLFCAAGDVKLNGLRQGCIIPDEMPPVVPVGKYAFKMESLLSDLIGESSSAVIGYEFQCRCILSMIITDIMRISGFHALQAPTEKTERTAKIRKYLDGNFTAHVNLRDLAGMLYLSPGYLSHLFKNETGSPLMKYITVKRIEYTKKLLVSTDLHINEIAEKAGYEDPNYFSKLFKKTVGQSPVEFRRSSFTQSEGVGYGGETLTIR